MKACHFPTVAGQLNSTTLLIIDMGRLYSATQITSIVALETTRANTALDPKLPSLPHAFSTHSETKKGIKTTNSAKIAFGCANNKATAAVPAAKNATTRVFRNTPNRTKQTEQAVAAGNNAIESKFG